jgi:hypothetical protein
MVLCRYVNPGGDIYDYKIGINKRFLLTITKSVVYYIYRNEV